MRVDLLYIVAYCGLLYDDQQTLIILFVFLFFLLVAGSDIYLKPISHDAMHHGLVLTVKKLKPDYAGTYTCAVDNKFGHIQSTVNVKIVNGQGEGSGAGKFEFTSCLDTL